MPKIVAIGATSVVDVLDGNSVVETIVEYAVSLDGKIPPGNPMMDGSETITDMNGVVLTDGTWSTEIPTIPEGQWLWTRTRTFYSDGQFTIVYNVSRSGNDGSPGAPGIGYTAQKEQWYLSSSSIKLEGGAWSDNEPSEIPDGKYLWGRIEYTMSDGSTRYSDAIYRSMISGLVNKADEVEKKIEQKIWVSDIENSINSYDGSTGKSIRDRVAKTETDITGINTSISDIQSSVSKKADGTTVTTLSEKVNTISDTVDEHTQTISSNTSRLNNAEAEITSTKTIASQTADKFTWIVQSGDSASNFTLTDRVANLISPKVVIKDPDGNSTIITGGKIQANAITTAMLATDAIKSSHYSQSENPNTSPYSGNGTFLDLANGNFWTPNFSVIQVTPSGTNIPLGAWFNGTVYATAGRFGDGSAYFDIETFKDFNQNKYAGLVAEGNAYIETGNWQVSNNSVATRKYITTTESAGQLTYYRNSETGIYYDVGMKIPTNFSSAVKNEAAYSIYNKSFFYGRKSKSNYIPTDDDGWDYLFQIDHDGNIYEQGQPLNARYAAIGDVEGQYVSTTGGTVNGNLTVTGTLTATASNATKVGHSLSINNKSFDGSATVDVGTIGVGYGGTGATSFTAGTVLIGNGSGAIQTRTIRNNTSIGALGWTSTTADTTLVTTNTLAYWNGLFDATRSNLEYVKLGKLGTIVTHDVGDFISASGGTIDGNLTVTGTASFTGGLSGDLTGNITGGSTKVFDSGNGTATTFAYSKSGLTANWTATPWFAAWNGYELRAISVANVKTTLGLENVENTKLSTWTGSANITTTSVGTLAAAAAKAVDTTISSGSTSSNLPTTEAVASFVEGQNYGVLSVAEGTVNGKISVTTASGTSSIAVHGLGSWAYKSSGTASDVGLSNVTNNKQIKGLSSGTTSGHLVSWGTDGYTVADSGITTANVNKTVTSLASNNDGKLVLTYLDGTSSDPIEVKIIGQSGSSVSYADALNVNGAAVGSASKPVFINAQGKPQQANTIPTITLNGSATTSASFYAPTSVGNNKQYLMSNGSGAPTWETFSKSTVGLGSVDNTPDNAKNVLSASSFTDAQSITLTGDTTGTVSSTAGWSLVTETKKLSNLGRLTSANVDNTTDEYKNRITYFLSSSSMTDGKPPIEGAILNFAWDSGRWGAQLAIKIDTTPHIYIRGNNSTSWDENWLTVLDSNNYNNYAPSKAGTGATGTWGISITGNAATATNATSATTATNADYLANHVVDATTIDNTAGTFSFTGSGTPWAGLDWVGLQVGSSSDKWQLIANNSDLQWRQNDSGSSDTANWTTWKILLDSSNYSNYTVPKTGGEFTGAVTGTSFATSSYIAANSGNSGAAGGIALYGTAPTAYGIAMRQTSNGGKHGHVQGDWAIYSYMSGADNRGWILKNNTAGTTVASVDNTGNVAFNGEVSIGTSGTNIDGSCSLIMNRDLGCLDFVFN